MTEAEFQKQVIALAHGLGLAVFHSTDSRRDIGKGYPDLTIVSPGGVLFAELKTEFGRLSSEQTRWRYKLLAAGQQYRVWTPEDMEYGNIRAALENLTDPRIPADYDDTFRHPFTD